MIIQIVNIERMAVNQPENDAPVAIDRHCMEGNKIPRAGMFLRKSSTHTSYCQNTSKCLSDEFLNSFQVQVTLDSSLRNSRLMVKLPTQLLHEPLVDAVFEVRMGGDPHLADLLPGILFGQLEPKPKIQRLPAAEIPQPIRASDPNMAFAPVIRLDWRNFTISFGDRNLVIGCKLPYPKWPSFREAILDIVPKIAAVGITGPVERYSIKYVNLIQAPSIAEQIAKIAMTIKVGEVEAKEDHLSVQVHRNEDGVLHIISVTTSAQVMLPDGNAIHGAVVDVDSIKSVEFADLSAFAADLPSAVDALRLANKIKFFSCLTKKTIDELGPKYD